MSVTFGVSDTFKVAVFPASTFKEYTVLSTLYPAGADKFLDINCASLYLYNICISVFISRKGGKLFRAVLIRKDTIGRTSDRVIPVTVCNAGITGSLLQFRISDIQLRPELSQFLPLARVDITATFIASFIFFDKGSSHQRKLRPA